MSSTHCQLNYHIVFGTKNRAKYLVEHEFRNWVFGYIAGIVSSQGGFAIQVGGWIDHVHILARIPARCSVSEFVGILKCNSSRKINRTSKLLRKFGWQEGFGAFTVSNSQIQRVAKYIQNQERHHHQVTSEEEYRILLRRHGFNDEIRTRA